MSRIGNMVAGAAAVATAREALAGTPAWVVGGAVRDAAMGHEVVDVDIAVEPGAERAAAQAIARAANGSPFRLSAEFGSWRVIAPDRSWHVDITPLRGDDLNSDLRRRDFTVNAIALPLASLEGEPIDPTGGVADLERRVLRVASDASFADDPLRLLRAARIAGQLGLEIEENTLALGRSEASRAEEPAGERRLGELRLLIGGPDPVRGLELLDDLGATTGVLPELAALRGVEQNPNHHLDVHGHTIEVLRQTLEVESDLDRYTGESAGRVSDLLAEPLGDGFTRREGLRLGALLHDAGKPATKGEHSGYVTFIGHDSVGAALVEESLARLKAGRALTRHVAGLARHHLHLGFMVYERPLPPRRLYEYLGRCGDVAPDVTLLTAADRMSARGSGAVAAPEMIASHLELVREVLPAALDWHRDGPPSVPIAGDELARELGIGEGPDLGGVIDRLRIAVFAGEVSDRDEAIAHARHFLEAPSD